MFEVDRYSRSNNGTKGYFLLIKHGYRRIKEENGREKRNDNRVWLILIYLHTMRIFTLNVFCSYTIWREK